MTDNFNFNNLYNFNFLVNVRARDNSEDFYINRIAIFFKHNSKYVIRTAKIYFYLNPCFLHKIKNLSSRTCVRILIYRIYQIARYPVPYRLH